MNDPVPCFFTISAVDEAAHAVMGLLSPSVALDITEVSLRSDDFEHDIGALLEMDRSVEEASLALPKVVVSENFNPLFLPVKMEKVDELLDLHAQTDAVRFTGMDGNPFTIKLVNVKRDGSTLITAKVQYHPFDLPSYSEIVEAHERTRLN